MLPFAFQVKISKKYALVYCTLKYKSNILTCAVVHINLLQINCKQFVCEKCVKKVNRHPLVEINNINVHGQRICSHCIFLENFDTCLLFDLLVQWGFYARCSNTWSPSVRPSVCKISAIRNSPDCNHVIDWLNLSYP
jgi:hypothetical protein